MTHGTNQPARFGVSGSPIQLTAEQNARLDSVRAMIAKTYRDDDPNANAAYNAGVRYIRTDEKDRDGTIEDTGQLIAEARNDLDLAYAAARAITILAIEDGKSEVAMSQAMGVDRMTIRKWVGKR
ncbi:hypothetical protein [Mycobacterium sp.]|uniref:hypothetical protein n=1 Tax=Mycobacterium sp. TaxID=1785 RepID=UPI002B805962|nr:hypothetical protein [Mycobacterium sp.]HTY33150.1 hypothetical protein [Mycobacterium sp.]